MEKDYSVEYLLGRGEYRCSCGKTHSAGLKKYICRSGALESIPGCVSGLKGTKAYIVEDAYTYEAAGKRVERILEENRIPFVKRNLGKEKIEPDERTVGSVAMYFDYSCDIIIGVGSGVINDICKIISGISGLPYIIVATAPSMDGYASSTSSVIRDGLKYSLKSRCPDCIVADTDILKNAPYRLICAGFGDMLAKYISICEWRIGALVTGEYYCEEVASVIRCALKKCIDSYKGLKEREPGTIENIFEGLVISGIAADYAGISRPVSGTEHYISHIWDMRSVEFGTPCDFHGIQCGTATLCVLKYYEKLRTLRPDINTAREYFRKTDLNQWAGKLKEYLGRSSEKMIEAFPSRELYNPELFESRIGIICSSFDDILKIIEEELPDAENLAGIMEYIGCPCSPGEFLPGGGDVPLVFRITKDIRDKYILSALAFDMGVLDGLCKTE